MKALSSESIRSISYLLEQGHSVRSISKQLKISVGCISNYKKALSIDIPDNKGGRPNQLSLRDKNKIKKQLLAGASQTAKDVQKGIKDDGINISYSTAKRAIRSMGFTSKKKVKKPLLSKKHQQTRLEWAKAHQHWTVDDWRRVVWSDETKINVWGSDGIKYYWSRKGDFIKPHHLDLTVKHGGGSLMMWGCMTYYGVGYACQVYDGTMKKEDYIGIMDTTLRDSLEYYNLGFSDIIFQQDNDPKHTAKVTMQWFKDNCVNLLPWPAQSPDLNPIEHLWHHLKLKLSHYEKKAKGIHELWERVEREWNTFTAEECQRYVESMPKRIEAVIKAKGGHTKF